MIWLPESATCEYATIELAIYGLLIAFAMILVSIAVDITKKYRDDPSVNKGFARWIIVISLVAVATGLIAVSALSLLSGGSVSTVNCLLRAFQ